MSDLRTRPRPAAVVLNWALALATILGAAALVVLAYGKVMATAACTADVCEVPSETLFTVLLSFVTARRPWGIVVPVAAWVLLAVDLVLLMVSFRT